MYCHGVQTGPNEQQHTVRGRVIAIPDIPASPLIGGALNSVIYMKLMFDIHLPNSFYIFILIIVLILS